MKQKHGFKISVYMDAKILADIALKLDSIEGIYPPRNFSALVRQIVTQVRDSYVAEEFRITSLDEALTVLDSMGFNTHQFPEREITMLKMMAEDNERIEMKPSSLKQLEAKAFIQGKDSLTKEERKHLEKDDD